MHPFYIEFFELRKMSFWHGNAFDVRILKVRLKYIYSQYVEILISVALIIH